MIIALSWQLRPYYDYREWSKLRTTIWEILTHNTMQKSNCLIRQMLSAIQEKQKQKAKIIWYRMDYSLDNPAWQANLKRLAAVLFPDDSEELDEESTWNCLKNRIEQAEMQRVRELVPDEFENDDRFALAEEERWSIGKPRYEEMIQGIEFLEPVVGIDF
ncbi:MAG: hypothetical protein HUU50_17735 [Candidatus Brocadiae bacterium]|nr:hypothetical protein [Candidatus Brocadiia bacterium]